MVDGGGVPFSVVYFDGEKETNVGEVTVDPSFNFNKFMSVLSQKIGISPHQFSVYLATIGSNRRIPITAKANIAAIARDNGASFFFVKRSNRRPRKNKKRNKEFRNDEYYSSQQTVPENVMLLRRNPTIHIDGVNRIFSGFNTTAPVLDRVEYEKRVRNLQMERVRYLMNGGGAFCEECSTGMDGGFHWCVYDAVTVGFRSPAGPVARPVRGSG